ncbi:MAG: hypothetical protein ACR2G7_01430 [Acidimicrobiales bacterium]
MTWDEQMPVLAGHPREDGLGLKVWCRWCDCWHVHGDGSGHRVAHCGGDTPYAETGYLILEETHYDDLASALPPVGDEQAIVVCVADIPEASAGWSMTAADWS